VTNLHAGAVATWISEAASRDGLSVSKLLDSDLLKSCELPESWPRMIAGVRLLELICEAAKKMPTREDETVALVALNRCPGITGNTPTERFRLFAKSDMPRSAPRNSHPATLARRWARLQPVLAQEVVNEIERRNAAGWDSHAGSIPVPGDPEYQPFVVDRLDVTYFVDKRRICYENITQRSVTVDFTDAEGLESIDHYNVRARYTHQDGSDDAHDTQILPMLNCTSGKTVISPDGWVGTAMHFPRPLADGQSIFFASRVLYATDTPTEPFVYIQVTSLGVMDLTMRVQFDAGRAPSRYWVYGGRRDPDTGVAPEADEQDRFGSPNEAGYVEYRAEDCPPGWFFAIGWVWD
jgi:hypothetical protein